jgi:protein-S-isoprenylcysteine O-methyltransferase
MSNFRWIDVALPLLVFIAPLLIVPDRLLHPGPWIGLIAAMIILFTQPRLSPKDMVQATGADRRSALWIYVGMIVPQIAAILHYGYRDRMEPPPISTAVTAGLILVSFGLILRIWAIRTLGRFFTSTVRVQSDQIVVETGPYRLLRHPSYTGALLIGIGVGIALWSWIGLLLVAVLALPAYIHRVHAEESALGAGLGQPYLNYCQRTKRLVPFLY